MQQDRRVRVYGSNQLSGTVRLPELQNVAPVEDSVSDFFGHLIADHLHMMVGSGVVAAAAGAIFGGKGSVVARTLFGVAGAAAGVIGGGLLGIGLDRLRGRSGPMTDSFVAGVHGAMSTPPPAKSEDLRVLDWNVHELNGPVGDDRLDNKGVEAIVKVVNEQHPDVLVLQEVIRSPIPGDAHDDTQELARRLGATSAVFVPNRLHVDGYQKGAAILTFGGAQIADARGLRHADMPGGGYFPRTTADTIVTTAGGNAVRVLGEHLSGTGHDNTTGGTPGSTAAIDAQFKPVVATLGAWNGTTILAGDFNTASGSPQGDYEAALLGSVGMTDAFTAVGISTTDPLRRSFPYSAPSKGIDRIYTSAGVQVRTAQVLADDAAREGSDHLPVVADLHISGDGLG